MLQYTGNKQQRNNKKKKRYGTGDKIKDDNGKMLIMKYTVKS